MEIILLAVPIFFLLIVVELIAERLRGTDYYRLNDSLTSLATGTLNQLMNVMHLLIPFTFYVFIYNNFALFNIPQNALTWVLAFVAYDICYYWNHRFGHEMNLMWAAHVVHHSSEEFNLTTALRQTSGSTITFLFYLPLALIGIDPALLLTVGSFNLIYQYWVHTQHIDKLGWMEKVFVTPSNHRGHHAQNAVYIDRNYGGVFILWDRVFGSYQEELDDDKPIFGIRGALRSWNPVWANLQVFNQLWLDCRRTKSWWHKLTIWFRRTGWRPPDVAEAYPLEKSDLNEFTKFDTQLTTREKFYAALQYLLNTGVSLWLLLNLDHLGGWHQILLVVLITYSSYSIGMVLEQRRYAKSIELIKYLGFVIALLFINAPDYLLVLSATAAVLSFIMQWQGLQLSKSTPILD